ncbi:hypothetical protein [Vibrio sp. 10N]|uniref:hypothetical protein n=1 Tax=Vibrio sp. 10N TaxID=3058938 RepID=UPI0028141E27|nr:hypothetical protein VB10N_46450 [Vibrio sp. 10N]
MDKFDIESALELLIMQCKKNNIKLAGALEIESADAESPSVIGFTSTNVKCSQTESFKNIHTMVNTKGDLDQFLMELSTAEPFYHSEEDERSISFGRSNPQIYVTQH